MVELTWPHRPWEVVEERRFKRRDKRTQMNRALAPVELRLPSTPLPLRNRDVPQDARPAELEPDSPEYILDTFRNPPNHECDDS